MQPRRGAGSFDRGAPLRPAPEGAQMDSPEYTAERGQMVAAIVAHTIFVTGRLGKAALSRRVLEVMGQVPRHEFVPAPMQPLAYADTPLPVGHGKTISQPFIVALMTDLLDVQPEDKVLEVGTGLGYQTAVLAHLARRVYSIELIEALSAGAALRLKRLGLTGNVDLRIGDGRKGWPEQAPFPKIIVTAAPAQVPPALLQQLAPGGRMVIPAGERGAQQLTVVSKGADGTISRREVLPVAFSTLEAPH
jgi:protein-L-isoaspartate(D-aspartate) O-methyltransferase